jgi:hypothetical protein
MEGGLLILISLLLCLLSSASLAVVSFKTVRDRLGIFFLSAAPCLEREREREREREKRSISYVHNELMFNILYYKLDNK